MDYFDLTRLREADEDAMRNPVHIKNIRTCYCNTVTTWPISLRSTVLSLRFVVSSVYMCVYVYVGLCFCFFILFMGGGPALHTTVINRRLATLD